MFTYVENGRTHYVVNGVVYFDRNEAIEARNSLYHG